LKLRQAINSPLAQDYQSGDIDESANL